MFLSWIMILKIWVIFFNNINKDPDKWSPALRAPGYDSIPVHVEVVIRSDIFADNGDITDSYNMFDFRPGRYVRNEAYYVRLSKFRNIVLKRGSSSFVTNQKTLKEK